MCFRDISGVVTYCRGFLLMLTRQGRFCGQPGLAGYVSFEFLILCRRLLDGVIAVAVI